VSDLQIFYISDWIYLFVTWIVCGNKTRIVSRGVYPPTWSTHSYKYSVSYCPFRKVEYSVCYSDVIRTLSERLLWWPACVYRGQSDIGQKADQIVRWGPTCFVHSVIGWVALSFVQSRHKQLKRLFLLSYANFLSVKIKKLSDVEVQWFGLSSFIEALVNVQPDPLCRVPYRIPVQEYGSSCPFFVSLIFLYVLYTAISCSIPRGPKFRLSASSIEMSNIF
jgi:hypothetical protein